MPNILPEIYEQHSKAFEHVSAYVVTKGDDIIATVAFKFAKSGMRTTCYLHILGAQMVRAYASGGGYDKCSASVYSAIDRVKPDENDIRTLQRAGAFRDAVTDDGQHWDNALRQAGFTVHQAV
ncbi:MAG: hypothetical protein PS018_11550 [bacterium]|nr:hypothetical protein [bacterium]